MVKELFMVKKNADNKKVREILKFIKHVKLKLNIPIILFNCTIDSLKKKDIQVLKLIDKIYVREKHSYDYLKKNNCKSYILPDFLTLLEIKIKKKNDKIIVTDSSIKEITDILENFSYNKKYTYLPLLYDNYLRYLRFILIKFLLKMRIHFIVYFYKYLKNLYLQNFLKKISSSNFIFTGRFHGIFICLSLLKPFYTFQSDTYKINGLLDLIGIQNRKVNFDNLENIKTKKFSKTEIYKIKKFQTASKKKFHIFAKEIRNIIKS